MKIRISGSVVVRNEDDFELVADPDVIKKLDGCQDTDLAAADYIGDGSGEKEYQAIGLTGGFIELQFSDDDQQLWVVTEYESPRKLTDDELRFLVKYTQGQWSDGIGESLDIPYADENGLEVELYDSGQTVRVEQC